MSIKKIDMCLAFNLEKNLLIKKKKRSPLEQLLFFSQLKSFVSSANTRLNSVNGTYSTFEKIFRTMSQFVVQK